MIKKSLIALLSCSFLATFLLGCSETPTSSTTEPSTTDATSSSTEGVKELLNYTSFTDEDGNEYLSVRAGKDISSVSEITIPNEVNGVPVKEIMYGAFSNCPSLRKVILSEGIEIISNSAFDEHIKEISVPNSIRVIEERAFINVNKDLFSQYENGYYIGNATNPYVALIDAINPIQSSFVMHESTITMRQGMFQNSAIETIALPSHFKSLPKWAFENSSIESITFGNELESIGYAAFRWCTELEEITLPNSVTKLNSDIFYECSNLKHVTLSNNIESIFNDNFYGCVSLELNQYNHAGYVGSTANPYLIALANDNVPSVTYHDDCVYLERCSLDSTTTTFTLGANTKTIFPYAFAENQTIQTINLNDKLEYIGFRAFSYCKNLGNVDFPDSLKSIQGESFYDCDSITSVRTGRGLNLISYGAFDKMDNLTEVYIEDCSEILQIFYTFISCPKLNYVSLPSNLYFLGVDSFVNSPQLTSLEYRGSMEQFLNTNIPLDFSTTSIRSIVCNDGTISV